MAGSPPPSRKPCLLSRATLLSYGYTPCSLRADREQWGGEGGAGCSAEDLVLGGLLGLEVGFDVLQEVTGAQFPQAGDT